MDLVKKAEEIGKNLSNTNQLRKFHGHLTKIWSKYAYNRRKYSQNQQAFKEDILNEVHFMKIFLAYQAGRGVSEDIKKLRKVLEPLIDEIKTPEDFEKFKKFYDAVLAYHKFYSETARNSRSVRK
ncbi:type III-A CRISPR-associated protein Csm2 [Thermotoga sp. SG1]|nr:type III-A CRISPR-associated protein Csm2 [Thermotoga sp. SG1]